MPLTRRSFLTAATAFTALPLAGQTARPDVAAIDHDRILTAAHIALIPSTPKLPEDLLLLSRNISVLAAAFYLTKEAQYATQAATLLGTLIFDPTTATHFENILDTIPLAEIAQALPFLKPAIKVEDLTTLRTWFTGYLTWLATSRTAGLARDQKDHHGASWLFQTAAYARLTGNEPVLAELRHRFKTVTLRAQLVAAGTFPHELTTPFPYRNSLFTLDLIAAACLLLSTPFDNLWEFELQDGPGLRVAMARHFPYIANRGTWPLRADLDHFNDLPARRPSLLFAARAYTRPEYATLWRTLNPDPIPELQPTFPINQPLLWMTRL